MPVVKIQAALMSPNYPCEVLLFHQGRRKFSSHQSTENSLSADPRSGSICYKIPINLHKMQISVNWKKSLGDFNCWPPLLVLPPQNSTFKCILLRELNAAVTFDLVFPVLVPLISGANRLTANVRSQREEMCLIAGLFAFSYAWSACSIPTISWA